MDADYSSKFRQQEKIIQILDPFFKEKIQIWNGHYKNGEYFYTENWWAPAEKRLRSCFEEEFSIHITNEDFVRLEKFQSGSEISPPIIFKNKVRNLECPFCEQKLCLGFDGKRLIVTTESCPYPQGLITEWELNVPSGKLVVANDLRTWFPSPENYCVNNLFGQHLTTIGYAKVGMSHGFVGNSCPRVYKKDDKFIIGRYSEEIWDNNTEDFKENTKPCPWGEDIARICTDLWWYSIVDYDEFLRRVSYYTPEKNPSDINIKIIDVRSGVYLFKQTAGMNHEGDHTEFASFEWIRDTDPIVDYIEQERTMNLSALEVLIENCLSWPTLYMELDHDDPREEDRNALEDLWISYNFEQQIDCLARAADQIMCVIGGGVEWHENGFPRTKVKKDARHLAKEINANGIVPPFNKKRLYWYPISAGFGGLCLGAGIFSESITLAPTFVLLGLNICQNAILYGETPRLNTNVWPPAYEIPFCRDRMRLFYNCYHGLRKKYPDFVFDTEFDQWIKQINFEEYVKNYDFGPIHPPKNKWGKSPNTIKKGKYFEFNALTLKNGNFCWHPKYMSGWASKNDAQRYCLKILANSQSEMGHQYAEDSSCTGPATVPLRTVGRVIRGTGEKYNSLILEIAFDYGTPEMKNKRWGVSENEMMAVRQFDDEEEYQKLLEICKKEFIEEEKKIKKLKK